MHLRQPNRNQLQLQKKSVKQSNRNKTDNGNHIQEDNTNNKTQNTKTENEQTQNKPE